MSKSINLPPSVYTSRQVLDLGRELELLSENLQRRQIMTKLGVIQIDKDADKLSPDMLDFLQNMSMTNLVATDIQQLIITVKAASNWPLIRITLATQLQKPQKIELVQWFRANLSANLLFQFGCDPELIGGMIVRTPARQYDWSFHTRLLANAASLSPARLNETEPQEVVGGR